MASRTAQALVTAALPHPPSSPYPSLDPLGRSQIGLTYGGCGAYRSYQYNALCIIGFHLLCIVPRPPSVPSCPSCILCIVHRVALPLNPLPIHPISSHPASFHLIWTAIASSSHPHPHPIRSRLVVGSSFLSQMRPVFVFGRITIHIISLDPRLSAS